MKYLLKSLLVIGILVECTILFGVDNSEEKKVPPLKVEHLEKMIKSIEKLIDKPEYKGMKVPNYIQLKLKNYSFKKFLSHPDLELETKIYKKWYEKISTYLVSMIKILQITGSPYAKEDKKMQARVVAQYNKIAPLFKKHLDNPEKLSPAYLKKLKEARKKAEEKRKKAEEARKRREARRR